MELDIIWSFLGEAINGIFFLLIGFLIVTDEFSVSVFFSSVIAIPISLGARYLSVGIPVWCWNWYGESLQHRLPTSIIPSMTWGGLRGGSSVALALSLAQVRLTIGLVSLFATYARRTLSYLPYFFLILGRRPRSHLCHDICRRLIQPYCSRFDP